MRTTFDWLRRSTGILRSSAFIRPALVAILFLAQTASFSLAVAQTIQNAAPISIEDADSILRARITTSTPTPPAASGASQAQAATGGCASGSQPIEIVTLASSLKCDIDLIYEYVYNNIEYVPIFGSNKGALGTLLDQSGGDLDQAQLFVALLNASGVTQTSFIYGYITITGPTAPTAQCAGRPIASGPGWLGVPNDTVAIEQAILNGGTPTGTFVFNTDGTLDCGDVAHVWVQVTIGGTNYIFDPSFKQHATIAGLGIGSLLGYNKNQFLADAGGSTNAYSISNINRANVRSDLTGYANNLISGIVSHVQSGGAPYSVNDVVGGKTIVPLTGSPVRRTSLPYLSPNQPTGFPQNWGSSVPNAYRACLAISMPGVSNQQPCGSATAQTIVLYSDQTYGQRITVFSAPDPTISNNFIPTLLLNGSPPAGGTNTGPSTLSGQTWGIYAAVTHPYAASGLNADQTATLNVKSGGSYLISAGWGGVSRGMVEKHRQLLAQALAAPGANPSSEPVLGESLAVIGYNWLAEATAAYKLNDALGHVTTVYHHGVGITAQSSIQGSSHQGPYVDLPLNVVGLTPNTCWPNTTCPSPYPGPIFAPFMSGSGMASSLESAVLEQTQAPTPNMIAASTVRIVDMNAASGAATYFADGTTAAGQANYINNIRPAIFPTGGSQTAYSQADIAFIDTQITGASPPPANPTLQQSRALLPFNGQMSVGLWKGAGYTVMTQTSNSMSSLQRITGGLSGGFSGASVPVADQVSNTDQTVQTPPAYVPTINATDPAPGNSLISEPIDAVSGAEIYSHGDLVIGNGSFPYALPFARTYTSSSHLTDIGLGNGWTHSYSRSAQVNSDPYEGLGATSPIRAAAAIAAIYVTQDLLASSSGQNAQSLTLAWMVVRWMTDQLTNNAVIVSAPDTSEEFVALPHSDGQTTTTYNPPFGSATSLTSTGSGLPTSFVYTTKDRTVLTFNAVAGGASSSPIVGWQAANGAQANFAYDSSGRLTNVSNNLGRTLTLSYSGAHVSSVTDGSRSASFGYSGISLISMTDPLGNVTTHSYDSSGYLNQVFYPNAPGIPFFTNFYDGLGRVFQQLNANGNATFFYFAGSRSETVDAVGNRHITYQTPRRKIVKDAAVLSPAMGDVFNDTPQQNGVVNVTATQYDPLDRPVLMTAPEGGRTSYGYSPDLNNNVASVTRTPKPGSPLSPQTTSYTYDAIFNKPTSVTDPRGLVTTMSYDGTGNLVATTADSGAGHLNATSRFTYTSVGLPMTSIDPLGVVSVTSYDTFGNATSVVRDAGGAGHLNQTSLLSYNGVGDVVSLTDPNGNVTTSSFDANRQRLTTTAPNNLLTTFTYDAVGQLLSTSQSIGGTLLRQTSTTFTPTGKTATAIDANGGVTTYTYDALDRLVSVNDPMLRQTAFTYDALGRTVSTSNPAIAATPLLQQAYTPDGLLGTLTDANNHATSFAYDGLNRLATTTYPLGSTEALTYDADNNVLTRKTRAGQTITFTYDTLNRLKTKTPPSPAPVVTYGYDLVGRLTSVSDTSAAITAAASPSGPYAASYSYDAMNRPTTANWSPAPVQAAVTASSVTLGHAYNKANQRVGQTATDNTWLNYPAATPSTTNYTANALNQYTAVAAVTPSYDGNGSLTSDGTYTFGYDAENRLVSASGAGNTASYTFDAQGRRKTKTVNATTTVFVTDADNREALEYDGSTGAIQRWYAYGLGPNAVLNQMNVTAVTRTTLVPDILGSIIGSLDSGTASLTKVGYLPYGKGASASPFGFTGQRIDLETNGLYFYRARHYSPAWGRFLQVDPIGYKAGPHLYAYVGNDPLNLVDPNGLVKDFVGQSYATFGQGSAYEQQATAAYYQQHPYVFAATVASPLVAAGAGAAAESFMAGASAVAGASEVGVSVSAETLVPQLGSKLEYFLGNATGNAYNVQQSGQMASQLSRIGLQDTAATRQYLTEQLTGVLNNPSNISAVQSNGNVVRESLLMGPGGAVKFQTIWDNTKLITGMIFGR